MTSWVSVDFASHSGWARGGRNGGIGLKEEGGRRRWGFGGGEG